MDIHDTKNFKGIALDESTLRAVAESAYRQLLQGPHA